MSYRKGPPRRARRPKPRPSLFELLLAQDRRTGRYRKPEPPKDKDLFE